MNNNKNKLIIISVCLFLALCGTIVQVFAWLRPMRDSMVLVAGDIEINVLSARYVFARGTGDDGEVLSQNLLGEDDFVSLRPSQLNTVPIPSDDQYVIYEFSVKNLSRTDIHLSLRLSEFSEYLFKSLGSCSIEDGALTGYDKINSRNYTAKNTLKIRYLKYSYNALNDGIAKEDIVWKNAVCKPDPQLQLWNYCFGEYIMGDRGTYEPVVLQKNESVSADGEDPGDTLTLRLAIENNFDQSDTNAYYDWLLKTDGECWKYCKRLLGLANDDHSSDTLIAKYLEQIKNDEQESLGEASRAIAGSADGFQLTINYFEFVGENIPHNDDQEIDPTSSSSV